LCSKKEGEVGFCFGCMRRRAADIFSRRIEEEFCFDRRCWFFLFYEAYSYIFDSFETLFMQHKIWLASAFINLASSSLVEGYSE
jgi:hypothetical protein